MTSAERHSKSSSRPKLIDLARDNQSGLLGSLMQHAGRPLEKALALDLVNNLYAGAADEPTTESFVARILEQLQISFSVPEEQLARIPQTGRVIVVANHPFGAIEGIILGSLLRRRRPDAKIMANHLLSRITEMRELFILVNPFDSKDAPKQNIGPMREAMRHLRNEGLLGVFPAGEVAHLNWRGRVEEGPWTTHVARLVRHGQCPVLPVYFDGHNSLLFHLAGLCHPSLRTALLARELSRLQGGRIDVQIGSPIPYTRLGKIKDDQQLVDLLRSRTMALACRKVASSSPRRANITLLPVIAPVDPALMEGEINSLEPQQFLADSGELAAYIAHASKIPHTLREIGRLRELTFRETGEGTGRELDIDSFDGHYQHLFIWHKPTKQVVGGYRIGFSETILKEHGIKGFYTHSLYHLRPELLKRLGPTFELGRSFVRPEFQKSYAPLLLLWKAIGRLLHLYPQYYNLLGPVSISATYQTISRQMMVDFLNCRFPATDLEKLARPRNPFRSSIRAMILTRRHRDLASDPEQLSDLISELEQDGKGLPVLLRQYLKLGAKALAFNVDPDFSDVLDALLVVDVRKADRKALDRYMGSKEASEFLARHGIAQAPKPAR